MSGLYHLLLPLKLDWLPLYGSQEPLRAGQRVEVNFSGKDYTAVVISEYHGSATPDYRVLEISGTCPETVADITPEELRLWKFISSYYLCTLGEVYAAAYPGYRIASEKKRRKIAPAPAVQDFDRPECLRAGKPVLYRGKDRVAYYIEGIRASLDAGFSALVLVPELEYTFILQDALKAEFGDRVFLYDSLITPAKKRNLADDLRRADRPVVVIGTKSALFLPFRKLGLIVVDEEQDASHKQSEPAPRYNARDVAVVLGSIHNCQVILGTFTPSLESLYNCKTGKYILVDGGSAPSCRVEVVNIAAERRKRGMEGDFSKKLTLRFGKPGGMLTIIRSYTSEQAVLDFFRTRFPGLDPQILTAQGAKYLTGTGALVAVLNADSFFDRDDFRADEKALQNLRNLALHTENLFIQCTHSDHPVYQAIMNIDFEEELLSERKDFRMPPYTRLVDIKDRKTGQLVERKVLERDSSMEENKKKIALQYGALYIIDVDPL